MSHSHIRGTPVCYCARKWSMLPGSFCLGVSGRDYIDMADEHHRLQGRVAACPLQENAVLVDLLSEASSGTVHPVQTSCSQARRTMSSLRALNTVGKEALSVLWSARKASGCLTLFSAVLSPTVL